ncbi:MAG: class I SAM-dependent methyltransferase [Gammaproteobacteria bacterium]|nr:class I SAM-dependent methyltransferase [Gammaproteobacteria bacterium]
MRLSNKLRNPNRCAPAPAVWRGLYDWYQSQTGQRLQEMEKDVLDNLLPDLFGYHLLYLGHPDQVTHLAASRVSHRMVMNICTDKAHTPDFPECFQAEVHRFPIETDSIDVVVLPHMLEFSRFPHDVLRETERVLIPEGHVVILGFNPFSFWMLWRLVLGWRGHLPWCGAFRSVNRMKDWLALLGFDVVSNRYYFFKPPVKHPSLLNKLGFLERLGQRFWPILGGSYAIVARKRVVTLTPIKPSWKSRKTVVTAGLAEPMSPHQDKENASCE